MASPSLSARAVTAFVLVQFVAFAVAAQESTEYGRATGGELVLKTKSAARLSGSLELSLSSGSDVFGRSNGPAYGVTAGGTLLQDRLWFFGSATRQEVSRSQVAALELPENAAQNATFGTQHAIAARVNARITDGHDFSAYFENARRPELSATVPASFTGTVPSSFLALRYTGIVSSNMFFSASLTRNSRRVQDVGIMPVE